VSSSIRELQEYTDSFVDLIQEGQIEKEFNDYAIRLYNLQRKSSVYGKLADRDVSSWEEIPCLPISVYKHATVISFPELELDNVVACFRSSGTTQSNRSSHYMFDLEPYSAASTKGYVDAVHPVWQGSNTYGLSAPLNPYDSSLVSMMSFVVNKWIQTDFSQEEIAGLREELEHSSGYESSLFGTTIALYDVSLMGFEPLRDCELTVVETGGMKGRDFGVLTSHDLSMRIRDSFRPKKMLREYGMSELSSQLYGEVLVDTDVVEYKAVPWMKYRIVDPVSGEEVKRGEEGIIQFYDLANVWSCGFVQTEDMGRITDDEGLILLGRAQGAAEKGCSMTFAQVMEKINE
jgi:hypothetical protein